MTGEIVEYLQRLVMLAWQEEAAFPGSGYNPALTCLRKRPLITPP
jgi:hypothetical protein